MVIDRRPPYPKTRSCKKSAPFSIAAVATGLFFCCFAGVAADPQPDKYYLRIAHGLASESNEFNVTSLGVVSFKNTMVGHVDLAYLDSDTDGKAFALDFGAGFVFNWFLSPYLSIGASLGYNRDREEAIAAYYPEVGAVLDVSSTFGMSISARRYYSLYEQDENIIMLGLVFRK